MTEENLAECRKIIYSLLAMENRSEMLPVPVSSSISGKGKTPKKDDQYKIMYTELEKYINSHCRTDKHAKVLNCLLESRNKPTVDRPPGLVSKKESDPALRIWIGGSWLFFLASCISFRALT